MDNNDMDTIKAYLTFSHIKGLVLRHKSNTISEFPKSITCTICHSYEHHRLLSKPLQCTTFISKPFEFYAYDYIPLKLWRYKKELINPQRIYLTISLMTHDKAMLVGNVTIIVRGDYDIENSSDWKLLDIEKIQKKKRFGKGKEDFGWKEYPDWKFNWFLGKVSWKIRGGYNKLTKSLAVTDFQKKKNNNIQKKVIKEKSINSIIKGDSILPTLKEKSNEENTFTQPVVTDEKNTESSPQKSLIDSIGFYSHSYTNYIHDGISDISFYSNRRKNNVTIRPRPLNDCIQPYKSFFQCIIDPLQEGEFFNEKRLEEKKERKKDYYRTQSSEKTFVKPPDVISFRQFEQSYSGITSSKGTTRSSKNSVRIKKTVQEQINEEAEKLARKYKEIYEEQLKKERKKFEESERKRKEEKEEYKKENTPWTPKDEGFCGITNSY